MEEELRISCEEKQGVFILRLTGDITKVSGEKLLNYQKWEQGLGNAQTILIMDFRGTHYINSAGIAYIIRLSRILREQNVTIRAFGLEYHYEKMFSIVGLTKYMTLYPSEWAAVEGLPTE